MGAKYLMVLFVLSLACHVTVASIFEPSYLGCKCLRVTSQFISTRNYAQVQIFPSGLACMKPEIIITLKTGTKVCVDPDAQWIQNLLQRVLKRMTRLK